MQTHVKVLGWFNVVLGIIGLLVGFTLFSGAMVFAEVIRYWVEEAGMPVAVLQFAAVLLTGIFLVVSLPCLILGYGLMNLRPWARIMGIVLAALNLLNVPIGTAISLYAFWVLLKPETEALFKPVAPPAAGKGGQHIREGEHD